MKLYSAQEELKKTAVKPNTTNISLKTTPSSVGGAVRAASQPASAKVYPQNGGDPYTGYIINGKTYKDPQGTRRIDNGSTVRLQDGRTYAMPGAANPAAAQGAYRTVYSDPQGNQYTGYIINGQTYKDPQGTQRVEDGSVVTMADGRTAVKGAGGGYYTPATVGANLRDSSRAAADAYDAVLKYRDDAIRAQTEAAIEQYNRRAEQVKREAARADDKAHDAYVRASNPYGPIGQRLEALGLGDSGYAESTYANLGNEYQKLLTERAIATEDALSGIYGDIEAARIQAAYESAMANAQTAEQKAAVQMQYDQLLADFDNSNFWNAEQLRRQDAAEAYAKEQDAWSREWQEKQYRDSRADADRETGYGLLQYGVDPKYISDTYGIPEGEARAIASYIQRQEAAQAAAAAAKKRSSGGGNQQEKKPDDVVAYIANMSEGAAYAWLTGKGGYSDAEAQKLLEYRADALDEQNVVTGGLRDVPLTNSRGSDWVYVTGLGKISATELYAAIGKEIKLEENSDGTYTAKKA